MLRASGGDDDRFDGGDAGDAVGTERWQLLSVIDELWSTRAARSLDLMQAGRILDGPCLSELCRAIAFSPTLRLEELNLKGLPLGDEGAITLSSMLAHTGHLRALRLESCGLGSAGASALLRALRVSNRTLQRLSLAGNAQLEEGSSLLIELHEALRDNAAREALQQAPCHLPRLMLAGRGLASRHMGWLRETLVARLSTKVSTKADAADARANIAEGAAAASPSASAAPPLVRTLNLSLNVSCGDALASLLVCRGAANVDELASLSVAAALGFAIAVQGVRRLRLDGNPNLSDAGAAWILRNCLQPKRCPAVITLSGTGAGDEAARAVASALSEGAPCASLLLGDLVGDAGAASLAEALRQGCALRELALGMCVGDAGVAALATALAAPVSTRGGGLERLCLGGIHAKVAVCNSLIGAASGAHLAAALRANGTLTQLELCGASLGDAGCASLLDGLAHNTRLTSVDLAHCGQQRLVEQAAEARVLAATACLDGCQPIFATLLANIPPAVRLTEWGPEHCAAFVRNLGLPCYAPAFGSNLNGAKLSTLTIDQLPQLGVNDFGHQRTVLRGVEKAREALATFANLQAAVLSAERLRVAANSSGAVSGAQAAVEGARRGEIMVVLADFAPEGAGEMSCKAQELVRFVRHPPEALDWALCQRLHDDAKGLVPASYLRRADGLGETAPVASRTAVLDSLPPPTHDLRS
ncbi:hypothetical protein Ctob_008482 [Chrysochromulina tobinii]|uniref:Uncharacterized protein n=1 Tax=Chrysochromulina tobinii TaxID=1460289 RepID=A0A0M0JSU6_9EUKA|nr:hypothetical protein Ctob_008482 [Chrysochromulina tobinii]|eukprot:KOO29721.1 hypothetical protein Ctob_008482 [Chrysochromulina sp. CCMP291]